ncbi:acyl-CoA synthetase (AMP-forming)/AMP-acid ligase II [Mycolicibacterium sp. BK556]|uniref:FadD7 family fatty acid--CoA ligase n=1 Tax=unclassified Mycolicibacterium TaxID=2636767 RepID=UPI001607143C|nr:MULTISPECIES: FadD7 family fatty acid--CoA ligase [unclassified Mycolicibacterium]MBB3601395.1 acyl-CoA synthetase (AMP-forming)/AMP-acid ligase II [Mycolicibacterium sp. BK556]MBB3631147.1 acyl-CoA synthetase (AMP-forming)/AMP-acid ligase II [Mycolicibacterium sp. BK607]
MLLGDLVAHTAATTPAAIALVVTAENRSVSYPVLADLIEQAATALRGTGLAAGDVVGLRAPNTVDYVVGLLGAARAGLVVAPLDPALPAAEQQDRMQRLGARAVLTNAPAEVLDGAPEIRLGVGGSHCTVSGVPTEGRDPSAIGITPDDAMVMFTSGTTGKPKMVPWTHDALAAAMNNVVSAYGLRADDATVAVMPMFHGHGLVAGLLATLASGGTLGLPEKARFSPHTFFDELSATGATWVTAVPTIYQVLLDVGPEGAAAAARLRFLRSCSAPLPPAVAQRLEDAFGAPVLPAYGMTEATHQACAVSAGADSETRLETVGAPVGAELRIADTGEVWLRGPAVARGYLNDPAATASTFGDGWLRTGDLGSVNDAGVLTLRGRIKNIINRGGEKISPERVEDVLLAHPDVVQAAVFPVPDDKYGEQVAAVVVLRSGAAFDSAALQVFCASRLAKFEVPERISPVDELPVTAKGSVDRNRLAQLFG